MNRRFHSNHNLLAAIRVVVCMIVFIGISCTILPIYEPIDSNNEHRADTTVLSFPAASLYKEQFDPQLRIRILELLPTKESIALQEEPRYLYPGGQPVGILLRTDGILVVGYAPIHTLQGELQPAATAGIQSGDIIIGINDIAVSHDDQLALLVNQFGAQGETITLHIQRNNRCINKNIEPIYCEETDTYRVGLLIRDNAGGVGTLTFVDPTTMQYGALGHMIANNDTQRKLSILNGKLVAANIQGIKKGTSGHPGEKIGQFVNNDALGTIEQNTAAGIFGTISNREILSDTIADSPLPVASPEEILQGPAVIYTALNGNKVSSYSIEIEKISQNSHDGKDMVIHITDQELLQRTGGIVQGMSGSPVIQNGRIVGAVTHVLVNDPTRGYGIFIENMLEAAK